MENMGKVIEEIGATKSCITASVIKDVRKIVVKKAWMLQRSMLPSYRERSEYRTLSRVFEICRKYKLSPEAIAQVLDKLPVIESGKW